MSTSLAEPLAVPRVNILGVGISALDMATATATLESWIVERKQGYVVIRDVHGVMRCQRDPEFRNVHRQAGLVTPDGMPLVWMAHRLGFEKVRRVYGPDLMLRMSELSARRGYRNYYYGGLPGVAERLQAKLTERFPGLNVVGAFSPPFGEVSPGDAAATRAAINAARPDIVWVGLGTPKQERWMAAQLGALEAPVMVGVGAAFDFLSGVKPQAPRWMQRNGLEWVFRMATEPRRLGGRYLRNNPAFAYLALRQLLTPKRFPQSS